MSLLPQVVDVVDVPVIAAGGIGDARGVVAALALGTEGVQMGTVFLACDGSGASRLHREIMRRHDAGHTGLTKGFTGRLARRIHNRLMEQLNRNGSQILPYPLQRELVRNLAIAAEVAGRADLLPMWAGQSANFLAHTDATALLSSLVEEISEIAGPVTRWSAKRDGKTSGTETSGCS
jgi:nitronate monooxygenase